MRAWDAFFSIAKKYDIPVILNFGKDYPLSYYCSTQRESEKPPNIVYILADDLGYGDVTCYNQDSKISTPNIDQLANEGIMFTDAHSPSSVSTPTRYGILTGDYCWRSPLEKWGGYKVTAVHCWVRNRKPLPPC